MLGGIEGRERPGSSRCVQHSRSSSLAENMQRFAGLVGLSSREAFEQDLAPVFLSTACAERRPISLTDCLTITYGRSTDQSRSQRMGHFTDTGG
jgi:hypothetical protein